MIFNKWIATSISKLKCRMLDWLFVVDEQICNEQYLWYHDFDRHTVFILWTFPLETLIFCLCVVLEGLFWKIWTNFFLGTIHAHSSHSDFIQNQTNSFSIDVQFIWYLQNSQSMIIYHHLSHFFHIWIIARLCVNFNIFPSSFRSFNPLKIQTYGSIF